VTETPQCRHCGGLIPPPINGYTKRRGFCSPKCNVAYRPTLRTVICANTTCKKGEGHTRKVFTTYQAKARCCCASCNTTQYQRELLAERAAQREARAARVPSDAPTLVVNDWPADVIERRLEALARRRRETRSWLRITDPWQQRAGSELHHSIGAMAYYDTSGAEDDPVFDKAGTTLQLSPSKRATRTVSVQGQALTLDMGAHRPSDAKRYHMEAR
jgi:hypothetical protein